MSIDQEQDASVGPWKELTEPRALEESISDGLPARRERRGQSERSWAGRTVLGAFRIDRFLDSGSVGRIYAGTQLELGRPVAIKILRTQEGPRGELAKKRFKREAKFLAKMRHPHIVELIEFGEAEDGAAILVMELLEGHTLKDHIEQRGPIAVKRAIRIARQLARAAARAHELGGIHRDLKPANIFLERDEFDRDHVKVLDFGLVKTSKSNPRRKPNAGKHVIGTPFYMSPEQALDGSVDQRADIYSLGVILYEMLTGVPPFRGETVADILAQHVEKKPPPLAAALPSISAPARLEHLIRRCMSKDAESRPSAMKDVSRELKEIQREFVDTNQSWASSGKSADESEVPAPAAAVDNPWIESSTSGGSQPWNEHSHANRSPVPGSFVEHSPTPHEHYQTSPHPTSGHSVSPLGPVPGVDSAIPQQYSGYPHVPNPLDTQGFQAQSQIPSVSPWADATGSPLPHDWNEASVSPTMVHPATGRPVNAGPYQTATPVPAQAFVQMQPPAPAPMPQAPAQTASVESAPALAQTMPNEPPPAATKAEKPESRIGVVLLIAAIILVAAGIGFLLYARQQASKRSLSPTPLTRPRAELHQGHIDSAPTASAAILKA